MASSCAVFTGYLLILLLGESTISLNKMTIGGTLPPLVLEGDFSGSGGWIADAPFRGCYLCGF
jgi:hypothetical protein